jgi:glucokinase
VCGEHSLRARVCAYHVEPVSVQEPKDITNDATKSDCPLCSQTVDIFLEIIGAEAGAMALRSLATGGVFIAGGIMPRIVRNLESDKHITLQTLRSAFLNEKSRFTSVQQRFPLFVLREEAGLEGVFQYALALARNQR